MLGVHHAQHFPNYQQHGDRVDYNPARHDEQHQCSTFRRQDCNPCPRFEHGLGGQGKGTRQDPRVPDQRSALLRLWS